MKITDLILNVTASMALLLSAGIGRADVLIASIAPFSGPLGENGEQNFAGAKVYLDRVNAQGGVHGALIKFIREDDRYIPDETVRLAELVAERDKPLAFINLLGSANVGLLMKKAVLEKYGIPAIGVTPGAESLRHPGSPQVFHLQAADRSQIARVLSHYSTLGVQRIAVVYQDNPFGKSGRGLVQELAQKHGVLLQAEVPMALGSDDATSAVAAIRQVKAQSYLMILAPNSAASFVRDVRSAGDMTPIYGLSYVGVDGIVKRAGVKAAAGVALAQVLPNPAVPTTGLVREYLADLHKYAPAGTSPSPLSLTGYLAARVAVEAIRRAGPSPSPSKVTTALRGIRGFDLGGYVVDFSNGSSEGSSYADIAVVDRNGRLRY